MSESCNLDLSSLLNPERDWIELFPVAITMSGGPERPILILQDREKKLSLPVWLGSLDAAMAMVQANPQNPESSPHRTLQQILKVFNCGLEACLFQQLQGPYQFVDLVVRHTSGLLTVRCRADESMSLCLHFRSKFFCPRDLILKSRDRQIELGQAPMLTAISGHNEPRTTELLN